MTSSRHISGRLGTFGISLLVALLLPAFGAIQASASQRPTTDRIPSGSFPTFRYGPHHVGVSPETTLNPSNVGALDVAWSVKAAWGIRAQPVVADGVAYVASGYFGGVEAVRAADGSVIWSKQLGNQISTGLSVDHGTLYVSMNAVNAFDAATGDLLWTYGFLAEPNTVVGGVLYAGMGTSLYALHASTGKPIWHFDSPGDVAAAPTVVRNRVFLGMGGTMYAFQARTGATAWQYATGGNIFSTAAAAGGMVYFGSHDNYLYALRASTGTLVWKRALGSVVSSSPAVTADTIYVGDEGGYVVALDRATGDPKWRTRVGRYVVLESPVYANGVVYMSSQGGGFYALDAATGRVLWSWRNGRVLGASPAVIGGTAYFASWDKYLYAFRLPSSSRP